jgi:hypothetical protein
MEMDVKGGCDLGVMYAFEEDNPGLKMSDEIAPQAYLIDRWR